MNFEPNWASPPGDTIQRLISEIDISAYELAARMGFEEDELSRIMDGKREIVPEIAESLAQELGSTQAFWIQRYDQYLADKLRTDAQKTETDMSKWGALFPIKSLRDFGFLPSKSRGKQLSSEILQFFGCQNISQWNKRYSKGIGEVAFRASFAFDVDELSTLAWLRTGEIANEKRALQKFSNKQFKLLLPQVKALTAYKHPKVFFPKLQEACARVGVGVVSSRATKGCRASGASWTNAGGNPVILLSFRHLSDDHFWFTFFHEAAHVVLHGTEHIDCEGTDPSPFNTSNHEQQADQFSQNILVPPALRDDLLNTVPTRAHVRKIARLAGVTPGIIVGQLQKFGALQPHQFNDLKRRYRWRDSHLLPELYQPRK